MSVAIAAATTNFKTNTTLPPTTTTKTATNDDRRSNFVSKAILPGEEKSETCVFVRLFYFDTFLEQTITTTLLTIVVKTKHYLTKQTNHAIPVSTGTSANEDPYRREMERVSNDPTNLELGFVNSAQTKNKHYSDTGTKWYYSYNVACGLDTSWRENNRQLLGVN